MIKKILFILSLFFIGNIVYAEKFTIGDYISGEYIKMVSNETSKYLTIQRINDSHDNFVYCIEPFVLVDEELTDYTVYEKDLSGYKNLTEEQKRRISLIAYYGYGYKDRMVPRWYAITQMLIWKTVDPESDFYFTDVPNGNKVSKYDGEMAEILNDVSYHDSGKPSFIKDYNVNYGNDLVINDYSYIYSVHSTYDYIYDSSKRTLTVSNVTEDGSFIFEKDGNRYVRDVIIFDSKNSQDLIRKGNVLNPLYTINVKVNSGDITLNIRKDTSIYTVEDDFTNTCYEISNGDVVVDKVCTGKEELVYKTDKLPYGEYTIKQVSVGIGYEIDNSEYKVVIDGNSDTNVVLNNKLIKNKIELVKYYCINDNCLYEENAVFNIFDKDNQLVGSITTNGEGYGYLETGYGKYTIVQEYGLDNYTFVDIYTENILNSSDRHYKELYNYYIEEVVGDFGTLLPEDTVDDGEDVKNQEIIEPPYTGTKLAEYLKMVYNVIMVVICSCNLKRFCYNN